MKTHELKTALRNGPYAWPGGCPLYFLTTDGSVLSFDAVHMEIRQVIRALRHPGADPWWQVDAVCINYEEPDLYCEHTGKRIESAYAEDEAA